MGNLNQSDKKYALLYGEEESGKTLFLYKLRQSNNFDCKIIESTYGVSYEEISKNGFNIGLFDVSGSKKQYDVVNIVTKAVNVKGIIFIIKLDNIDNIDDSKDCLERILGNNYINPGLGLFVIFNKTDDIGEKLDWMNKDTLDNRLGLPKLAKKYNLKKYASTIMNISQISVEELNHHLFDIHKTLI